MPVTLLLTFPFTHVIVFFSTGLGDGVGETVGLGVADGVETGVTVGNGVGVTVEIGVGVAVGAGVGQLAVTEIVCDGRTGI